MITLQQGAGAECRGREVIEERVADDWLPPSSGLHIYYPGGRHPRLALRVFIDHLKRGPVTVEREQDSVEAP